MKFITIGPFCWGESKELGKSVQHMRKAFPMYMRKHNDGTKVNVPYDVYQCEDEAYANLQGNIVCRVPPTLVKTVRFEGNRRIVECPNKPVSEANNAVSEVRSTVESPGD